MISWPKPIKFEWDHGNIDKNLAKHGISPNLAEEPFADPRSLTFPDPTHSSQRESRWQLIGQTTHHDTLFIVYTIRGNQIRIISVRPASHKERKVYEQPKA